MDENRKSQIIKTMKSLDSYTEKIEVIKRNIKKINLYIPDEKGDILVDESFKKIDDNLLLALHSFTDTRWVLKGIIDKSEK